jgi:hypothetical protein
MSEKSLPKVKVALLCDDVRREINGKEIIIGVFSDQINVVTFPVGIMITLYMRVLFDKSLTKYPVEIRAINAAGNQLVPIAKSTLDSMDATHTSTIVLGPIPLQIQAPGPISFQWRIEGGDEWSTIIALDVGQAPSGTLGPAGEVIIQKMTIA